jgi:hypothetical protein
LVQGLSDENRIFFDATKRFFLMLGRLTNFVGKAFWDAGKKAMKNDFFFLTHEL